MAESYTKQLEDKIARYERIINECSHCKAALAIVEVESATSPAVPPPSTSLLPQTAPEASSITSHLSPKTPIYTTRQGRSTRSLKQATSASQTIPSGSSVDVVSSVSSVPASSTRSGNNPSPPPLSTARTSARISKQTSRESVRSSLASLSTPQTLTAHSLSLRPTSLKPSTNSIDRLSTDASGHNTNGPSLGRSGNNTIRPRNDPHKQAPWVASSDRMLEEVPLGWVWNEKLLQLDKSMLAAVAIDTSAVPDEMISAADETQNKDRLLRLVRGFAHRHSDKRVNFQHFLLVCLCNVLSAQNIPRASIVEALQICISDTSEANIGKYLRGAQWVNKIMDRLFFTGWRYRAIDLMVIWDRSIAMYGKLACSPPSNDYFISHLTRPEYCKDVQGILNRVHDTIPWIVKKEFGDEVSYESICKALGYSNDYILETKYLHSSNPPSPDPDFRSSGDESSASRSRSFHTARQSMSGTSSLQQPASVENLPSRHSASESYLKEGSMIRRQLQQVANPDDAADRDPPTRQNVASPSARRMVPDRSAKPLGDQDIARRRGKPDEYPSLEELPVSTSMGESASKIQSSKRPLPESPTSAFQPINATRRRQHPMERSSREEMGPPSQPGKKGSKNQRGRA